MIIVANLNFATVQWARERGSVRNLRDRRLDLYRTRWRHGGASPRTVPRTSQGQDFSHQPPAGRWFAARTFLFSE